VKYLKHFLAVARSAANYLDSTWQRLTTSE